MWDALWPAGVSKLRRIGKKTDKGKGTLCLGEDDVMHIFMSSSDTRKLRKEVLNKEWLLINEEVNDRKILRCADICGCEFR
jgi:hypothetical protein